MRRGRGWPGVRFGLEQFGAAAVAFAELLVDESAFHGECRAPKI